MFHDQGQIALKLIGLGQGVTLLAGFPVPIATPGHGTAYDIAGSGKARPDGLVAATRLVLEMMRSP
jgi:4-hydroxythreonine-4-phosphate dehydrogenase